MLEGKLLKIVLFGLLLKQRHIGVAAASYWDKGGRPKINSMVRNIEDEDYIVWSTKFLFTKPPAK